MGGREPFLGWGNVNSISAKYIGINSGYARADMYVIAEGTGSVDETGSPLVIDVSIYADDIGTQIVDAVEELIQGDLDATFELRDDPSDLVDTASEFLDYIEASVVGGIPDLERSTPAAVEPAVTIDVTRTVVSGTDREVNMSSVQASVPGWTIFGLFWIVQILALSIIGERASGAYGRILVAPVSYASYLLGKAAPYLGVNLVQAALMLGIGIWVLPLLGAPGLSIANPAATLLMTLVISACAIALGLFMASLTRSAILVGSVSAVVLVIMTAIGGIMVPTFIMPGFMQKMSLLVPHGWALEGYLDAIVRGRPTVDVLPHAGVLLGFACVFFVLTILRMRSVDRSA